MRLFWTPCWIIYLQPQLIRKNKQKRFWPTYTEKKPLLSQSDNIILVNLLLLRFLLYFCHNLKAQKKPCTAITKADLAHHNPIHSRFPHTIISRPSNLYRSASSPQKPPEKRPTKRSTCQNKSPSNPNKDLPIIHTSTDATSKTLSRTST